MRCDKDLALTLRKKGKSYTEIHRETGIPKSTLSDWFRKLEWSDKIKKSLTEEHIEKSTVRIRDLNKDRADRLQSRYQEAGEEAVTEYQQLKYDPYFISGVMLYWGEGDRKTKHQVRLSNADPDMMKLFVCFLTSICSVSMHKIWASVFIYPDLEVKKCREHWSEKTTIPLENFQNSIVLKGAEKKKRLSYGTCTAGVSNAYLKRKMIIWLKLLPKDLLCDT